MVSYLMGEQGPTLQNWGSTGVSIPISYKDIAQDMLNVRARRVDLIPGAIQSAEVYLDGPVTFAVVKLESLTGKVITYTGWAKFNPNDVNYNTMAGVTKAIHRAVEKILPYDSSQSDRG